MLSASKDSLKKTEILVVPCDTVWRFSVSCTFVVKLKVKAWYFFGDEPIRHAFGFSHKTKLKEKNEKGIKKVPEPRVLRRNNPQLTVTNLNRWKTTSEFPMLIPPTCNRWPRKMFIPFAISWCLVLLSLLLLALFDLEHDINFREQKGLVRESS